MEFNLQSLEPRERYKLLIGIVVPRPIALVTTRGADGRLNAAPFSFFNVMSHDPPVVVLGIEQRPNASPKDTVRNIRETREFVVNIVDETIAEAMNICAIDFPEGTDELAEAGLTTAPATTVTVPRIAESPANLECRLLQELRIGGSDARSIIVGEVHHVRIRDDVVDGARRIDQDRLQAVGRIAASYVHLNERFEMPRISIDEWQARKAR